MTPRQEVLGIIPARGGSKGVRGKNLRALGGRPLIAHTLGSAQRSARITRLVTTTDDPEIAREAASLGCEVIQRPADLALDSTPMGPVAIHALDVAESRGRRYPLVILLQPTCPFRTAEDIDAALDLLTGADADAVIGVYRVGDRHPARMYRIEDGRLAPYDRSLEKLNRQELPAVYHRNGLIYAIRSDALRAGRSFFPPKSIPLVMPELRSVNIDEEMDLLYAEFLLRSGALETAGTGRRS